MFLPCKSLFDNTVYRSKYVVHVMKTGIKLRNTEVMVTRITTQDATTQSFPPVRLPTLM